MSVLRQLFAASRPVSWVNTAYPFAVAYLLSTRQIDLTLILGTLFFLVPYNLALYGINDVFDYESDLRNPRKGGIEGAVLDRRFHRTTLFASVFTTVPFLVYLVVVGSPPSWLVLGSSVFALIAYSAPPFRFKERPVLDSVTSSVHFVSPAVYGLALAGAEPTLPLGAVLVAFLLWGMASHAFGAVQDILPDREGGIASIATVLGARATVWFAFACYLAAGVLVLLSAWPGPLGAVIVLSYLAAVAPFLRVTDATSESVNRGWRWFLALNFVAGFLTTMLLIWYVALAP